MTPTRKSGRWSTYNAAQVGRPPRPLCTEVLALAGPGAGRHALDLGCGAGIETRAMLDAGWRVTAVDSSPTTEELVRETVGDGPGLTVQVVPLERAELPSADLVYAGFALPFVGPDAWPRVWSAVRDGVRPGGWLAVNLFGEHDSWAGSPGMTFWTRSEVDRLFAGLDVVRFDEEDADGDAFSGPKHWHVFDVIARRPLRQPGRRPRR